MVINRHCQRPFGTILANHIFIKVLLELIWLRKHEMVRRGAGAADFLQFLIAQFNAIIPDRIAGRNKEIFHRFLGPSAKGAMIAIISDFFNFGLIHNIP